MAELPKKEDKKDKKKDFGVKSANTPESKMSRLWLLASTSPMLQGKRRRSVMLIRLRISIAIRKVTMLATILSQKTSISLGNLYASNW